MGVLDAQFIIYIGIWFWKPGSRKVDIQELVENGPLKVDHWHRLARKKSLKKWNWGIWNAVIKGMNEMKKKKKNQVWSLVGIEI